MTRAECVDDTSGRRGAATSVPVRFALSLVLGTAGSFAAADVGGRGPEIELRAGIAGATARANDRSLGLGLGADLRLAWSLSSYASVYAGYGRRELTGDDPEASALTHDGYTLGLEVRWSEPYARLAYRLSAGVTHDAITVTAGPGPDASRRGRGWEIGASVLMPLSGGWTLVPGLRYRHLSGVSAPADGIFDDTLGLVLLEIGAQWAF